MKRLILAVFALTLLAQAVVSLRCYYCPYGRLCVNTIQKCGRSQDRCLVTYFPRQGAQAKRCATQFDCNPHIRGTSINEITVCCSTDLCNR